MDNEIRLLRNLQDKKRNSLEEVIRLYTPYVSTVIYHTIGHMATREDLEEVIADTFLLLWQNADRVDAEKGCIRSYIGAIARNTAKNKLRTVRVYEPLDESTESRTGIPPDMLVQNEERQLLFDGIAALGAPDSEIFLRYYFYGEKIRSIAAVMQLNASTVKSKLARGKRKLKAVITLKKEDL